jgi:pyruvate,water dikinase
MTSDLFVKALDGTGIDRNQAGGKGWALDRLVEQGFPVPAAFAVRADGYRAFAETASIARFIAHLAERPVPPPGELDAEAAEIEAVFLAQAMPPALAAGLEAAIADSLRHTDLLAVRSSATAEDLEGRSFAGQYRTYLDIGSVPEALDAVRR